MTYVCALDDGNWPRVIGWTSLDIRGLRPGRDIVRRLRQKDDPQTAAAIRLNKPIPATVEFEYVDFGIELMSGPTGNRDLIILVQPGQDPVLLPDYVETTLESPREEYGIPTRGSLTLGRISLENVVRSDTVWPQCREWDIDDWLLACLGELGEAANIAKKMKRDGMTPELMRKFHHEMIDLMTYCDLTIMMTGGVTERAYREKWNEVSERMNYPVRFP